MCDARARGRTELVAPQGRSQSGRADGWPGQPPRGGSEKMHVPPEEGVPGKDTFCSRKRRSLAVLKSGLYSAPAISQISKLRQGKSDVFLRGDTANYKGSWR